MNKKTIKIRIETNYVQLQQLLKLADLIDSGGQAKIYLNENKVLVNGELENRRGRKLYPKDIIEVSGNLFEISK